MGDLDGVIVIRKHDRILLNLFIPREEEKVNGGQTETLNRFAKILGAATIDVLTSGSKIQVSFSPTIQKIPAIYMKPDIGCFVQFSGDYSGLLILNFSEEAAMSYYREYMLFMGMSEDDLTNNPKSDEVIDSIGELANQIIGRTRQMVQQEFDLAAYNNIPKAMSLVETIMLCVSNIPIEEGQCRRLSFKIDRKASFHIEFCIEPTEFISVQE